jgi:hypothetical protein
MGERPGAPVPRREKRGASPGGQARCDQVRGSASRRDQEQWDQVQPDQVQGSEPRRKRLRGNANAKRGGSARWRGYQ